MRRILKPRWFAWSWVCVAVGLLFNAFGRDPFFPLGYIPKTEIVVTPPPHTPESILVVVSQTNCATEAEWNLVMKPFQVTGKMIAGSRREVYINRKPYPTGHRFTTITTTNSTAYATLTTTNRFILEVAFSEDKKPLLKRFQHVRDEPMYLPEEEARKRGLIR